MNEPRCQFCQWDMMEYYGRQFLSDGYLYHIYHCTNELCEQQHSAQLIKVRPMTLQEWSQYQVMLSIVMRDAGLEPPRLTPYPFETVNVGGFTVIRGITL